jgi:hypothetical protein
VAMAIASVSNMAHVLGIAPTKPNKKDKSIRPNLFTKEVFPIEITLPIRSICVMILFVSTIL